MKLTARACLVAAFFLVPSFTLVHAQTTQYYRYQLNTRQPEFEFAQEVSPDAPGTIVVVERDSAGHVLSIATRRKGKQLSRTVYHYGPGQKYYASRDEYTGSEQTGRVDVQRNAGGDIVREDDFTKDGTRTDYVTISYTENSWAAKTYSNDGHVKTVDETHFSPRGRAISSTSYADPDDRSTYHLEQIDENTSQDLGWKQFVEMRLTVKGTNVYDAQGDLIRRVGTNANGSPLATEEFSDGLRTLRRYDAGSAAGEELHYHYDEKRWLDAVEIYFNNALVCRLKYQRASDGSILKTVALGPKGDVWAEYPNHEILDINRDGRPAQGIPVVMHKYGNWW